MKSLEQVLADCSLSERERGVLCACLEGVEQIRVLRGGWPDVLIEDTGTPSRGYCAIEIKTKNDHLRPAQRDVHRALGALGVPVNVVREGRPKPMTWVTPKARAVQEILKDWRADLDVMARHKLTRPFTFSQLQEAHDEIASALGLPPYRAPST